MTKRRAPTRARDAQIGALLDEAGSGHEVVVSWSPGRTQPVGILLIRVNGQRVTHDELDTDSPFIATKLPPAEGGRFTLDWSIKPEVALGMLIVSVRNRSTGAQVVAGQKETPDNGDTWIELGVVVDAP
jgi:hypothetical protein